MYAFPTPLYRIGTGKAAVQPGTSGSDRERHGHARPGSPFPRHAGSSTTNRGPVDTDRASGDTNRFSVDTNRARIDADRIPVPPSSQAPSFRNGVLPPLDAHAGLHGGHVSGATGPLIQWTDDAVVAFGAGHLMVVDNALSSPARAAIETSVSALDADGVMKPAGVSRAGTLDGRVRSDRTTWLEAGASDPVLAALWVDLEACGASARAALWIGLRGMTVQLASYDAGACYARHLDAFRGRSARRLTAILYVHGAWEPGDGGELVAWTPAGRQVVQPLPGRLVVFASDRVEHEVLVTRVPRLAVTAWFQDRLLS